MQKGRTKRIRTRRSERMYYNQLVVVRRLFFTRQPKKLQLKIKAFFTSSDFLIGKKERESFMIRSNHRAHFMKPFH